MRLTLASAMGTCFGVQDAIDMAIDPAFAGRLTIVGQLVHNPQTVARLEANGVRMVERDQLDEISTESVMITAHGAADSTKAELERRGLVVYDATCPLVMRLHKLARFLERKGYFPVVVGQEHHVEVQGVVGNLRASAVVASPEDLDRLQGHARIGLVSQTTNRPERVASVVEAVKRLPWVEEVRYVDTICQPVKERQQAITDLLGGDIDLAIVVGGFNSSNTRKLLDLVLDRGVAGHHVERAAEVEPGWFAGCRHIGITAGTSTPQDVIEEVAERVRGIIAGLEAATAEPD